jgi:branched-chain amino acid transport system ATP-binding protein
MNDVPVLECNHLSVSYGQARALHGVSLTVGRKEIVALIGSNGAGKTTLLRTVSGLVRASEGEIRMEGRKIGRMPPHQVVAHGVAHIPEGRGVLGPLSIRDNLRIGSYATGAVDAGRLATVQGWFPALFERLSLPAAMLSGGQQQMLAIARAVLGAPKLLMVDELSLGLSPKTTAELVPRLRDIREEGASILLVDQSVRLAMKLADRIYILANGRVAWSGPAGQLNGDEQLMSRYLGVA